MLEHTTASETYPPCSVRFASFQRSLARERANAVGIQRYWRHQMLQGRQDAGGIAAIRPAAAEKLDATTSLCELPRMQRKLAM